MSKPIKLIMVYDCDLDRALEEVKRLLPVLIFEKPLIQIMPSDYGWRVTFSEVITKPADRGDQ